MTTPPRGSVVQRALGDRYRLLHPLLQEQYRIDSTSDHAWVGSGVMDSIWKGGWHVRPFIRLGSSRRILFPEVGNDVPFRVYLIPYRDRHDRECITWLREFRFEHVTRRFDEVLAWSDRRGRPVVLCGSHQHLAVDIDLDADENDGTFLLCTAGQRVYAWGLAVPWPRLASGDADVKASVDDQGVFTIDGAIRSPIFGDIFGYRGTFRLDRIPIEEAKQLDGWLPVAPNRFE